MTQVFNIKFAALVLTMSVIGWLAAPSLIQDSGGVVKAKRPDWAPPDLLSRTSNSAGAIEVAGAAMWGPQVTTAAQAASKAEPEDIAWRLSGVFGHGDERGVVITFAGAAKPDQRLKLGDKLPDGGKIKNVQEKYITVRSGKREYRVEVQRSEQ